MTTSYVILRAPNASMMTGPGTNTILLTTSAAGVMVIDPADESPVHLDTIVRIGNEHGGLRRILITHGHPDHVVARNSGRRLQSAWPLIAADFVRHDSLFSPLGWIHISNGDLLRHNSTILLSIRELIQTFGEGKDGTS